jgi:hypothetical protein
MSLLSESMANKLEDELCDLFSPEIINILSKFHDVFSLSSPHELPCFIDQFRQHPVTITARVKASRFMGGSLSFHDITNTICDCSLQIVLTQQELLKDREYVDAVAHLLRFVLVTFFGRLEETTAASKHRHFFSFYASSLKFVRVTAPPAEGGMLAIERILLATKSGHLCKEEACSALNCNMDSLSELFALQEAVVGKPSTPPSSESRFFLKQALLSLSRSLAGLSAERPLARQRLPTLSLNERMTLQEAEKSLQQKHSTTVLIHASELSWASSVAYQSELAQFYIDQDDALHPCHNIPCGDVLFKQKRRTVKSQCAISATERKIVHFGAQMQPIIDLCFLPKNTSGISNTYGSVTIVPPRSQRSRELYAHVKKGPQIYWFLEALSRLLPQIKLPGAAASSSAAADQVAVADETASSESVPLSLIDVGGGRGDLALAVAARFGLQVRVTVIDCNESSLHAGRQRSSALGLTNIDFVCNDALSMLDNALITSASLFIGLHTCGGLTDVVLALALRAKCPFLLVPCCYPKNADLVLRCAKYGLTVEPAARAAAAALCGEKASTGSAFESPVVTQDTAARDHILLCKLAESTDSDISHRASVLLNTRRLVAVAAQFAAINLKLEFLEAFSKAASKRNLALVASPKGIAFLGNGLL